MDEEIEFLGKTVFIETDGKKILAVGDLHLGYEASLNASGVFVTRTLLEQTINELHEILDKTGKVDEIVLLGDIKHTFGSILKEEWKDTDKIISLLKENCKKVVVIRGNHDALTDIIGKRIGFEVVDYYITEGIVFIHGDKDFQEMWNKKIRTVIMGHIHPAIFITDSIKREKYKCFLKGEYKKKEIIVAPSFISAQEGTDPRDFPPDLPWKLNLRNFNVYIVGENLEVLDFGKLKNIN